MAAAFLPPGKQAFFDDDGEPLIGGKVYHYIPGTDDFKDTWQDYGQAALNSNPIILDARGECVIFGSGAYRQVLTDADDNEIWDQNTTIGFQTDIVLAEGSIFGLTIGNAGGASTTIITVALGQCRDSTNSDDIELEVAINKDITAVWAEGNNQGGRDTAVALAASQSWHVHVIKNPTDGTVDALFSQSPTAPVLPNGYTMFRRLGSLPRLGGSASPPSGTGIPIFLQWGDQFTLASPNNEFTGQTGSTAAAVKNMLVPLGIKVKALMYAQLTLDPNTVVLLRITDPDLGVPPAFGGSNQFAQIRLDTHETYLTDMVEEVTNTSGQLYVQCSVSTAIWALKSRGWIDLRTLG